VETWQLCDLVVSASSKDAGKITTSTATVTMRNNVNEEEVMEAAIGIGPVDATFKAILKLIGRPITLTQYQVTKIEGGSGPDAPGNDALASVVTQIKAAKPIEEASVELPADFPGHMGATVRPLMSPEGNELGIVKTASSGGITYTGIGHSTDIIVASARAYISAINRMVDHEAKQ